MLQYPEINPIALNIGVLQIHWYGLSYLLGICLVWINISFRARKDKSQWDSESISDIVFYAVVGVLLGGRLGYIFFYNYDQFLSEPLIVFKIWQGGMSFHGGLLGVLCAIAVYSKKKEDAIFQSYGSHCSFYTYRAMLWTIRKFYQHRITGTSFKRSLGSSVPRGNFR